MRTAVRLCALLLWGSVLAACQPPPSWGPQRDLVFPVAGKVSFTNSYDAPRAVGRVHRAQDLMAAKGTPVVAATDGTVTFLRQSNTATSGNMLIITDAEGWTTTYIHLNNDRPGTDDGANIYEQAFADGIRQGQKVRAGELIGWVGDSGNAENTGSHLHFEMAMPDKTVVNPYWSLLKARRTSMTASERAAAAPVGHLDGVDRTADGVVVAGWALDASVDQAVDISVYVDGNPVLTRPADVARPDISAIRPDRTAPAGFRLTVTAAGRVCAVAHSISGGGSTRLGCLPA